MSTIIADIVESPTTISPILGNNNEAQVLAALNVIFRGGGDLDTLNSYNISSVSYDPTPRTSGGTGRTTITFQNNLPNTNYNAFITGGGANFNPIRIVVPYIAPLEDTSGQIKSTSIFEFDVGTVSSQTAPDTPNVFNRFIYGTTAYELDPSKYTLANYYYGRSIMTILRVDDIVSSTLSYPVVQNSAAVTFPSPSAYADIRRTASTTVDVPAGKNISSVSITLTTLTINFSIQFSNNNYYYYIADMGYGSLFGATVGRFVETSKSIGSITFQRRQFTTFNIGIIELHFQEKVNQ